MIRFTMSGQSFAIDLDITRLDGEEVLLIERLTGGTAMAWQRRLIADSKSGTDMLLVAYLARRRENPMLEWEFFIKTVAPYSVSLIDDDAPSVVDAPPALDAPPADPAPAAVVKKAPAKPRAPRPSRARKPAATS